jgi:predicted amidohydrolase
VQDLKAALVQCELVWEQPDDNRKQFATLLDTLSEPVDLIMLPEMFTTGFSMNALANAEQPGGPTEQWMLAQAQARDCAITGSIAVQGADGIYNRMLFATPEGVCHYDKRHLFRMAGEHKRYQPGQERVIVKWRDWRINLQVCYDLRFPVFCRNRGDYDLMLFVANWPARRRMHWRQLLIARAIENLACVIGVNRIGSDASGLDYSGDSMAVEADGELQLDLEDRSGIGLVTLDAARLATYRAAFPCHLDADDFSVD